jgi:small subunit ribosomal protein S17|tara:strand:- start:631 stop:897 length:267 start_codon:yes stop_codon:yes gene_type:complete
MEQNKRKIRTGKVVSDSMDKTAVVVVEWSSRHRLYKKSVRRTSKYYAHDENNACSVGANVKIMETRPTSKTKRWRVIEIVDAQNETKA